MNKGIIVMGPAASGKSTVIDELIKNKNLDNFHLVNPDHLVEDTEHEFYNNPLAASKFIYKEKLPEIMKEGKDFILDTTGANFKTINEIIGNSNYTFKIIVVCMNPIVCLFRNANRDRRLPIQILLENWIKINSKIELYEHLVGYDNIYYHNSGFSNDEMEVISESSLLDTNELYDYVMLNWGEMKSTFQKSDKKYTPEELELKKHKLKSTLDDIVYFDYPITYHNNTSSIINRDINKWITLEQK